MDLRGAIRTAVFDLLYSALAPAYDVISAASFGGEWARWQAVGRRYVGPEPVVELGCGPGHTVAALRAAGHRAYGVDISAPLLAQARQHAPGTVVRAHVHALPLRDASVGTLLSVFPSRYICESATWSEARRVLKPGGRLVVVDHGWLSGQDPLRLLLRLLHRLVYGQGESLPRVLGVDSNWSAVALVERTTHGYVSVHVATPRT